MLVSLVGALRKGSPNARRTELINQLMNFNRWVVVHKSCLFVFVWPILVLLFYFFRSASGAFVLFFPWHETSKSNSSSAAYFWLQLSEIHSMTSPCSQPPSSTDTGRRIRWRSRTSWLLQSWTRSWYCERVLQIRVPWLDMFVSISKKNSSKHQKGMVMVVWFGTVVMLC